MLKEISKNQSCCSREKPYFSDDNIEKCCATPVSDDSIFYKLCQNIPLCAYISSAYYYKENFNADIYNCLPACILDSYSDNELTAIFKNLLKSPKATENSLCSFQGITDRFYELIKNNGSLNFPEIFLPLINGQKQYDEKNTGIYSYTPENSIQIDNKTIEQTRLLFDNLWFKKYGCLNISYMTLDEINTSPFIKAVSMLSDKTEIFCYPIEFNSEICYSKFLHWFSK